MQIFNYVSHQIAFIKCVTDQSTSSILLVSTSSTWASSSGGRSSSSALSSSKIERPSLIILWILLAKYYGSSSENPEVRMEVSYMSQTKSLTVLSDWSISAFLLSSSII